MAPAAIPLGDVHASDEAVASLFFTKYMRIVPNGVILGEPSALTLLGGLFQMGPQDTGGLG